MRNLGRFPVFCVSLHLHQNNDTMADKFENTIHKSLHQYLVATGNVDERLPECPDVTDRWEAIGQSYIPDGEREYRDYPVASLGWMMYIGMATAAR